jgi:large subunit ribosomal protein L2
LRNGKRKKIHLHCFATIGRVSNLHHQRKKFRKAGDNRNRGIRPSVRGVAMNPVDHPHGGGKGKKSKNAVPEAPWGRLGARKKIKKNDF